jgi:hypothetical protein
MRRRYPGSRWDYLHSVLLFMLGNILVVAVGIFSLCIDCRPTIRMTMVETVCVFGLVYGCLWLQKEWRNTGGTSVTVSSNALPMYWTGISRVLF